MVIVSIGIAMESEDDMHDANDVASVEEEDDYYSGGEEDEEEDMEAEEDYNYSYDYGDEEDEIADYDFIANDSDDRDDVISRHSQVY